MRGVDWRVFWLDSPRTREPVMRGEDIDDDDRPRRGGSFRCPFCGCNEAPITKQKVSTAGWAVLIVLLIVCFPLCWLGLFIKDDYHECYECGMKIGG